MNPQAERSVDLHRSPRFPRERADGKRSLDDSVSRRRGRGVIGVGGPMRGSGGSKGVVYRNQHRSSQKNGQRFAKSESTANVSASSSSEIKTAIASDDTRIPNSIGTTARASGTADSAASINEGVGVLASPLHGYLQSLGDPNAYVHISFAEYRPFYEKTGPVRCYSSLMEGLESSKAEVRLWHDDATCLISQNSTKRKVYNSYWLPKMFTNVAMRVALKCVEDCNVRDGRSIKREIECHMYIYHRLVRTHHRQDGHKVSTKDWPCAEILSYYLDKSSPSTAVLVMRKLSGPDFFDIIRSECSGTLLAKTKPIYEFNKLDWCITALDRIAQMSGLGIRHNDIKPDNIVLDVYYDYGVKRVDVKLIDLGAASMAFTPEFTGGTSWYESPEQKLLKYYTEKHRNLQMAQLVGVSVASDAWGAGLSIVEVLLGRRVVDCVKAFNGPGTMEPCNLPMCPTEITVPEVCNIYADVAVNLQPWWLRNEYWEIPPNEWVTHVARVLKLYDANYHRFPLCARAAQYVFEQLVHADPKRRTPVAHVAAGLRRLVTEAISVHL